VKKEEKEILKALVNNIPFLRTAVGRVEKELEQVRVQLETIQILINKIKNEHL